MRVTFYAIMLCLVTWYPETLFADSDRLPVPEGTSQYVFVAGQSTITQTGGIAGVHRTYSIEGRFQLQVDPEAGTASFLRVDANAVDDSDDRYALDPNEVFNLTSLATAVIDATSIRFEGKTDDGSSVLITLTFADDTVTLCGATTPPPNSADFFIFALDAVAQRKYAGGSGTADDPYRIATAADLITLGETPEDYDKHFLLTADIDLDPNLPGRKVFDEAVIAPAFAVDVARRLNGAPFTGVFDGNGHTISHLTIVGEFSLGLFGQLGWNFQGQSSGEPTCKVTNLAVEDVNIVGSVISAGALAAYIEWAEVSHSRSTGRVSGKGTVGGLVGYNTYSVTNCHSGCTVTGDSDVGGLVGNNNGSVTNCCSTGAVSGKDAVGGLVGRNGIASMLYRIRQPGDIDRSYSTAAVRGETCVGGLIGDNRYGSIRQCYSTGAVSGNAQVGGLLSGPAPALDVTAIFDVTASFWDIETSGQTVSEGGIGKTTAEMQTAATYLDAGWDFVGETANGTEDVWWILEGRGYPRLWWELPADDFEDGEAGPL